MITIGGIFTAIVIIGVLAAVAEEPLACLTVLLFVVFACGIIVAGIFLGAVYMIAAIIALAMLCLVAWDVSTRRKET